MMQTPPPSQAAKPPPRRWAYSYVILPPQPEAKLGHIRAMLADEHLAARARKGTWKSELVVEPLVTGILVVADAPDQRKPINHRVERALKHMSTGFALSVPLPIDPDADLPSPPPAPRK
jgi:hypothetical protein